MRISSHIQEDSDIEEMLSFYKNHFSEVHLLTCKKCRHFLAFLLRGGADNMGLSPNELGYIVVPIGSDLKSTRVRLDTGPHGERMMGFECGSQIPNPDYPAAKAEWDKKCQIAKDKHQQALDEAEKAGEIAPTLQLPPLLINPEITCGNDTRLCSAEMGEVPVGHGSSIPTMSPFEKHKIIENMKNNSDYKPDFKQEGSVRHYDNKFELELIS